MHQPFLLTALLGEWGHYTKPRPLRQRTNYHLFSTAMLWLKALHVIFVVTWFAGLFYLPRLYVYHAQASDVISTRRFETMERRLFAIMTIGAAASIFFGGLMLFESPG